MVQTIALIGMSYMNADYFLDTNVLVYAHTNLDPSKQQVAARIIQQYGVIISTQVLQEFINVLVKKFKTPWSTVRHLTHQVQQNCRMHTNGISTIETATQIAERYQFSFYDSLIVASALETGVDTLYSEDLQHQQVVDGRLTVVNPFFT